MIVYRLVFQLMNEGYDIEDDFGSPKRRRKGKNNVKLLWLAIKAFLIFVGCVGIEYMQDRLLVV